jgi:hypothetical protein
MHDGTPLLPPITIARKSFKSTETSKLAQCKTAELIIFNIPLVLLPNQNWTIYRLKTTPYLNRDMS